MTNNKICFVSQFPPPIHGLSKAIDTLYNSSLQKEFLFEKIDIKDNTTFLKTLFRLVGSNADLFYFTISQSKAGNMRDLLILIIIGLKNKKCLVHLHGGYYRTLIDEKISKWQKKMNYNLISKIDGAIVLGPSLKWIFTDMLPNDSIYTVANCVDDQYLMSDKEFDEKMALFKYRKVKQVLYLSNFIHSKGYADVLEMAKKEKEYVISGEPRMFHFDLAGIFFDDNEKIYFDNFVKQHELENYVTYHGVVSGDQKKKLLHESDIFVLLTRYPKEGQPISILEAMGNGMMIVTTNHAGIPDIVKDGINGIVVEDGIPNLRQYANNIQKFQIVNRITIKEHYTEQQYISAMRNVFNSVLRSNNGKKEI